MKAKLQPANHQLANTDYASWLANLKQRVRMAQLRAAVRVNTELIQLYWDIGHQILEQQEHKAWGSKVIPQLSKDLMAEFSEMKGFSVSNLKFMRMFALQCSREQIGQQPVNQLPWGHIIVLMTRVDNPDERLIYAKMTVENGWSRSVLVHQIELQTAQRVGKALTNFERTIPEPDSELAIQTLKDPYKLQFLEIENRIKENEMRARLVDRVATFLIELGAGFTYVGKAVPITVAGDDFEMDLLFYHVRLHRYVVIELKTRKFKPQDLGQLSFYMTAIDEQVRDKNIDGETIGLLLCKSRNSVVVDYTLRHLNQPLAVSTYDIEKLGLPSIDSLQNGLTKALCDKNLDIESKETQ